MKISKKAVIITGIVLAAAVGIGVSAMGASNRMIATMGENVRTVTLEKNNLRSTVSSTGTIYSANAVNVYSTLGYQVKTINVAVGDYVEAGDVLLELDTAKLESDIEKSKSRLSASQATAYQSITTARQDIEVFNNSLANDHDSALLAAERAVQNAENSVALAKLDIESSNVALSVATRNFREAYDNDNGLMSDNEIRNLRSNVTQQEISLQRAQNAYDQSKVALENAKINLEIARTENSESARNLQNRLKSAQLNGNFDADLLTIAEMERDLADCMIIAPVSGTITAVNAKEGAGGSGLMFVIQKTDDLKVITNIKEYDVATVQPGDKVVIKTDATGEEEFIGELSKIAPTTTLTAAGDKTNSTEAEFEAEVTITAKNSPLRIGMNARLNIVTEEKSGVFSVPFEAVEYINGQNYVYVQETAEDNTVTYRRIEVETGLETNIHIEIDSSELAEGMVLVRNVSEFPLQLLPQEEVIDQ